MRWDMTIAEAIKMRKFRTWASAAVIAIGLGLFVIGCGEASNSGPTIEPSDKYNPTGTVYEKKVRLENGDAVRCLIYDRDRGGGISCDWLPINGVGEVTP